MISNPPDDLSALAHSSATAGTKNELPITATAFDEDLDRDHPLVLRYNPPEGWLQPLALPSASARHEQARAQIAAIALDKAQHQQPWISYSRNRNHYSRRGRRYDEHPELYQYSIIPPSVDALVTAGYLKAITAPRDPNCGRQSTFRATPALIEALGAVPPPVAKPKQRALVQLRDEQKQLIDFTDTEKTHRMRGRLVKINEAIGAHKIELPAGIGERYGDLLVIDRSCINLGNTAYFRIFNVDFRNGGRMYGHWTQSLPKAIRKQLTINGEPVAEPDYLAHHLCILYALEGLRPPGNPYEIEGWDREIVKRAVLIAINAKNLASTIGAIIYWYEIIRDKAARLVEAIKRKHKLIEKYFHSGAGLWLQRIDSDMAERVVLEQSRQGNPVLPVHDSFVAPARLEGAVREQMDEAFETIISRERGASRKSLPAQRLKPKSSYTMVDAFPLLRPLLLSLPVLLLVHWPFRPSLMIGAVSRSRGWLLCWMQNVVVAFGKRSLRTWPLSAVQRWRIFLRGDLARHLRLRNASRKLSP